MLNNWQIGGRELTDALLNTMISNAVAPQFDVNNQTLTLSFSYLSRASPLFEFGETTACAQTVFTNFFPIRSNRNGMFSHLPQDYEFPEAGAYD